MEVRGIIEQAHAGAILCVTWFNGRLFTGAEDGTIRMWDSVTLKPDKILTGGHTNAVSCLEAAPDIKVVFSASTDGTIICWSWNSGMKPLCSEKIMVPALGLVWDTSRQLLLVAGKETVFVFSLQDGKKLVQTRNPIKLQHDYLTCITASNGKIAAGSFDKSIQMFDPTTGRKLMTIREAHAGGISALCFDSQRETLVSGSYDQRAKIWSRDGTEIHELRGFPDVIQGIAVNPITGMLWIVANSSTPLIFDPTNGVNVTGFMSGLVPSKNLDQRLFQRIKYIPEIKEMCGITNLREVILWKFNDLRPITSVSLPVPHPALACCQASGEIYSAESDGSVWVWEPATQNPKEVCYRPRQVGGHGSAVLCMAFDEEINALVTGCEDHTVRIWGQGTITRESDANAAQQGAPISNSATPSTSTSKLVSTGLSVPAVLIEHKEKVSALVCAIHAGKHYAISGGFDGFLCVWNTQQAQLVWKGEGCHDSHIVDIAYSPKENEFAVSTAGEGSVHIWSLENRKQVKCLVGHEGEVIQVRWNELTNQWITGSHDHTIRTWNSDGSASQVIETEGGITALCIDLNTGNLVVAGASDHSLQVYNSLSPFDPPIRIGIGHEDSVIAIVHVIKKTHYATTSWDRTLRIWKIPTKVQVQSQKTT